MSGFENFCSAHHVTECDGKQKVFNWARWLMIETERYEFWMKAAGQRLHLLLFTRNKFSVLSAFRFSYVPLNFIPHAADTKALA